jgi:hypothetical protein
MRLILEDDALVPIVLSRVKSARDGQFGQFNIVRPGLKPSFLGDFT